MILAPSSTLAASPSDIPVAGLRIVATVHETIELVTEPPAGSVVSGLKNTGSRGKWHERFGQGR